MKKDLHMQVKISTPNELLFEGEASSVSSVNSQGNFDILPLHADFVTLVQGEPIRVKIDSQEKQFSFKTAVIHVDKGAVRIYGDVG